ncbi:protein TAP1-like [Lycium barbarum]|uniref:protein TAP1-like n=1 Tax=Lycium barbarum TaxID=112863 RepID=UPI00293EB603|nr:protein TAP1-like [Lycium barbarum]
MAKMIEANIVPFIIIGMLVLISNSQLVYCGSIDPKCFMKCAQLCFQNPGCYMACARQCGGSLNKNSSPMHYCNLGCSIHKCASLIKDDKQWQGCMKDCSDNYCKIRA